MVSESSPSTGPAPELLSKVTRYEALFELTSVISAARDVESVAEVFARRLKYIADVISWRYICFDGDPEDEEAPEPEAIVVDGYRGRADVLRTRPSELSDYQLELWRDRKTLILCGEPMREAQRHLPDHFQRPDLEQISVNTLVEDGATRALHLFCRRRQAFSELDVKCLSMVTAFFHRKVSTLWEQQKLRDLELAFLEQEVMLRQSEKLATLGRLSAGMAHELNNPAAAATRGAEHLRSSLAHVEEIQLALGAERLSSDQRSLLARLIGGIEQGRPPPDPMTESQLEQDVEDWLERKGIEDGWKVAPNLVEGGLGIEDLEEVPASFDASQIPVVIDYLATKSATSALLDDIGSGTRRVSEIVEALKGYSYVDQAPIQPVDVREGLDDTLAMLHSKLHDRIRVEREFEEDLPRIQAYGSELNQVWTHLIDNAIAAVGGEGSLQLRARQEPEWIVVEVEDNGSGIPHDVQDNVFDPFFTTKPPGDGAGLGLSVSHTIVVQKHGGEITFDSQPGATRFRVRLPRAGPPPAAGGDGAPANDQGRS